MRTRRDFLSMVAMAAGSLSARLPLAFAGRKNSNHPGGITPPTLTDATGARSLRAHAEAHGLLVGSAVAPERLDGESEYAGVVAAQSNILVAESVMKWRALRPAPDKFDFRGADEIVAFALTHEQKMRGHNLCWHEALPDWFAGTVTKDNARQMLTQHIQTVAGRYAGKMHSWDVVNEAIDTQSGRPDGLRKSPWLDLIGPDYLELAFRAAQKADPAALLTYNDYGFETDTAEQTAKRAQLLLLVRRLKARGVPLDAVGVQSHLKAEDPAPGAGLREFVREMRRMNLQVFVTEMDVNERKLQGSVAERDAAVARIYRDYVTQMLAEPNVGVILTWGITDGYSWLNDARHARPDGKPQRPLPFDSDYQPAPAFFALRDAIDTRRAMQSRIGGSTPSAPPQRSGDPYAPFTPKPSSPQIVPQ